MSATRTIDLTRLLPAAPEAVWAAWTTGEGITRWFAPQASVTPGPGGSVTLSWGPGMEGTAPITVWEPFRRFGWTENAGSPAERAVEIQLEPEPGGATRLRLVHSGFPEDADGAYNSTSGGWHAYLALLEHFLTHAADQPGKHIARFRMAPGGAAELRAQTLAALDFRQDGACFEARIGPETPISGRVLFDRPPGYLTLAVDSPYSGALALFWEDFGGQVAVTSSWFLNGPSIAAAPAVEAAWDALAKSPGDPSANTPGIGA